MPTFLEILRNAGVAPDALAGDAQISSLAYDSRKVGKGALFICMPSENSDSHSFAEKAVKNGASAVLAHSSEGFAEVRKLGVACALVCDEGLRFSEGLWRICRAFYQNPTQNMKVAGVTGTNGKTTTAWLIRDMMAKLGLKAAYLGTLGFQLPGESRELSNTTPFSPELFELLGYAQRQGVDALAMEVSSHALSQRRVDGVEFDVGVFTNLSQDHLDFHGNMDAYAAAKYRLFAELGPRSAKKFRSVLNVDDPFGKKWASELGGDVLTFGRANADLVGKAVSVELQQIQLQLKYEGKSAVVQVPLGGSFNVQNCMSAVAGMLALGFSLDQVAEALHEVRPVPGRFEPVPNEKGVGIIVDYAHTPDALEKLLDSVRQLHPARIVTVFGCGGDRDRSKRPKMAKAASERSDVVVLTSDNPRTEDPLAILKEVEKGLVPGVKSVSIVDRREAITCSLKKAKPGDVVVIAGKGHENYQLIGREKFPMDDREIAREALRT